MVDQDKIKEMVESGMSAEEIAAAWEEYVRGEVSSLLDIFLPEAVSGNVGVLYKRPIERVDAKTGQQVISENTATGVDIHIVLDFPEPVTFYDEKPSE